MQLSNTILLEFNVKKFTALFICLLMVITCSLAGCAGFSVNKVKYYNEVLATVGDTHITRYDLLTAYNSYGQSYYVSQMGEEEDEALASTLNLLIDREALYQYASNAENNETYKPTAYQVNLIVEEVMSSLSSQMDNYVKTAKAMFNIEEEESSTDSSEEETAYLYEDYAVSNETRRAFVKDTITYYTDETMATPSTDNAVTAYYKVTSRIEYNLDRLNEPDTYEKHLEDKYLTNHKADGIITAIQTKFFSKYEADLKEAEPKADILYKTAIDLFTKDLLEYEHYLRDSKGKQYSKTTSDLLYRYIQRTFDSQIESQYIENIRTEYLKEEQSKLSIDLLLDKFERLYKISYNTYNNNEKDYKTAMKDIGTKADSILYHPTLTELDEGKTSVTKFGYFVHTLINFNETQKALYEKMEKFANKQEKDDALVEIMNMFSTLSAEENQNLISPRDAETGLVDTSIKYSLQQVIDEYNLIKNNNTLTYAQKLNLFVQFMFKYTGDTATLSAGMPYVVGTNGYSAMEKAFTDECVKLMETGNKGAMSDISLSNLDDICVTPYGIHIVMYVGEVDAYDIPLGNYNEVYIQNTNKVDDVNGSLNLYNKVLNPLTGETYFDMLFDAVYPESGDELFASETGYDEHEKTLTETSKKAIGVTKYKTRIKATKVNI